MYFKIQSTQTHIKLYYLSSIDGCRFFLINSDFHYTEHGKVSKFITDTIFPNQTVWNTQVIKRLF